MLIAARNEFAVGKRILPPGARWVEYLQSTGTQWIDTGYVPNEKTVFTFDYMSLKASGTPFECPFGTQNGSIQNRFYLVIGMQLALSYNINGYSAANALNSNTWPKDKRGVVVFDATTRKFYIDGALIDTDRTTLGLPTTTLALFARKSGVSPNTYCYGRIYEAIIEEQGKVLHRFRPIAIGTTGYMLDLVSGEYLPYGNQGTGAFVIGPDKVSSAGGGII